MCLDEFLKVLEEREYEIGEIFTNLLYDYADLVINNHFEKEDFLIGGNGDYEELDSKESIYWERFKVEVLDLLEE
ncbi:MAG: hypothetical protein CL489_10870 [Acidobacteria bacterium]|mgnify:CR=1 FL=1|nr:hypothetical protein [Acidobacteriota bacterium]|tara:strand:- start:14100 stop:14324 length:225 start_codon:yes stop_codon:yes gene_type:complete